MDFYRFSRPQSENQRKRKKKKRDKYLDLSREQRKLRNMRVTVIPMVIGALRTVFKGLERKLNELEIGRRIETIQTIKICQNIVKSPGDLRRLTVTQTTVKDVRLTLV